MFRRMTQPARTLSLLSLALGVLGTGCTQPADDDDSVVVGNEVRSQKSRVTNPTVSSADRQELAAGNQGFALDLYAQLRSGDGNLMVSPHSISEALAMTYAGAGGTTAEQMADVMHYTLPQPRLHPAFNELDLALASRGQGAHAADGKAFRLKVVNAIWGQQDFTFKAPFLDTLAENYGAGLRVVDYIGNTEGARQEINQWVSDQTEAKIPELIAPGILGQLTRLVLTNAVYFNAAWKSPFAPEMTQDGTFHLDSGSTVSARMMNQGGEFNYAAGATWKAVELPYEGEELSMVLVLPTAGTLAALEQQLDGALVDQLLAGLHSEHVALSMPKFTFTSEFMLGDTLVEMGMTDAFSASADFLAMTEADRLHIGNVIHKSFIAVDEKGTEAAAATAVVMEAGSAAQDPVYFTADRPFLFLIRDLGTGALVFLGRVANPT